MITRRAMLLRLFPALCAASSVRPPQSSQNFPAPKFSLGDRVVSSYWLDTDDGFEELAEDYGLVTGFFWRPGNSKVLGWLYQVQIFVENFLPLEDSLESEVPEEDLSFYTGNIAFPGFHQGNVGSDRTSAGFVAFGD